MGVSSFPGTRLGGGTGNVLRGAGAPNGLVVGAQGDIYERTDGGAATSLYVKESGGTSNTGWVAVSTGGATGATGFVSATKWGTD